MCLKYDQGVPVAFVVRLGRTHYASDMVMALCCIKAPRFARFIHSSTGYQMSWTYVLGHAGVIQIVVPEEDLLLEIEEAERNRRRPIKVGVRAWLTDDRRLQFGHYGQLKLN